MFIPGFPHFIFSNSDLHPALFYLLEWHYQHLVLDENGPFIIRQHCASLLALIGYDRVQHVANGFSPQNWDRLFACFSKWFNTAAKYGVNEVITFLWMLDGVRIDCLS